MKRFSERCGLVDRAPMQIDDINKRTRNRIWNRVKEALPDRFLNDSYSRQFAVVMFDELGLNTEDAEYRFSDYIKKSILQDMSWNDVYELIELILDILPDAKAKWLTKALNNAFESENCAYRIMSGTDDGRSVYQVQLITNELELQEVEQAAQTKYDVVNGQVMDAISRLSDFDNPDYTGAVHSAISAVESAMRIADSKASTLGDAIKRARKAGAPVNPRLLDGLNERYSYANETVRHGTREPVEVTQSEAKLVIVTCSAIANYLLSEYAEQAR